MQKKIYAIFENRVKNGEEIASYNGGGKLSCSKIIIPRGGKR
jgi:hypothetical protein